MNQQYAAFKCYYSFEKIHWSMRCIYCYKTMIIFTSWCISSKGDDSDEFYLHKFKWNNTFRLLLLLLFLFLISVYFSQRLNRVDFLFRLLKQVLLIYYHANLCIKCKIIYYSFGFSLILRITRFFFISFHVNINFKFINANKTKK